MKLSDYPKPWISPLVDGQLRSYFCSHGKYDVYNKGDIVIEQDHLRKFVLLKSGMFGNSIVNYDLNKPYMMCGIRIPWQLTGYTTYMVKEPAPVFIRALVKCEAYTVSFDEMDRFLAGEPELKKQLDLICAKSLRSDLDATLAITTMPAEDCFWILFAALLMANNANLEQEWIPIPVKISRSTVAGLLYVSMLTIDRLYASIIKKDLMRKEKGTYYLHNSKIHKGVSWIKKRVKS